MDRKGGRRVVGEEKRKKKEKNSRGESAVNLVLREVDSGRVGRSEGDLLSLLSSESGGDGESGVTLNGGSRAFRAGSEERSDNRDDVGGGLGSVEGLRTKQSQQSSMGVRLANRDLLGGKERKSSIDERKRCVGPQR